MAMNESNPGKFWVVTILLAFCLVAIPGLPGSMPLQATETIEDESDSVHPGDNPPAPFSQTMLYSMQDLAQPAEAMFSYSARFRIGSDEYYIDDTSYVMDVKPYTSKGRSFIPVRFLAYACGLTDEEVSWSENTRTITLKGSPGVVRMRLDSNLVYYNDEVELMDVCPELRTGRIFLPARYVVEFFGFSVDWESATRTVIISS